MRRNSTNRTKKDDLISKVSVQIVLVCSTASRHVDVTSNDVPVVLPASSLILSSGERATEVRKDRHECALSFLRRPAKHRPDHEHVQADSVHSLRVRHDSKFERILWKRHGKSEQRETWNCSTAFFATCSTYVPASCCEKQMKYARRSSTRSICVFQHANL